MPLIGIEKYGISFVCRSIDIYPRCPLNLCIQMNSSIWFDTMNWDDGSLIISWDHGLEFLNVYVLHSLVQRLTMY